MSAERVAWLRSSAKLLRCYMCRGRNFWSFSSPNAFLICWRCHPPAPDARKDAGFVDFRENPAADSPLHGLVQDEAPTKMLEAEEEHALDESEEPFVNLEAVAELDDAPEVPFEP